MEKCTNAMLSLKMDGYTWHGIITYVHLKMNKQIYIFMAHVRNWHKLGWEQCILNSNEELTEGIKANGIRSRIHSLVFCFLSRWWHAIWQNNNIWIIKTPH